MFFFTSVIHFSLWLCSWVWCLFLDQIAALRVPIGEKAERHFYQIASFGEAHHLQPLIVVQVDIELSVWALRRRHATSRRLVFVILARQQRRRQRRGWQQVSLVCRPLRLRTMTSLALLSFPRGFCSQLPRCCFRCCCWRLLLGRLDTAHIGDRFVLQFRLGHLVHVLLLARVVPLVLELLVVLSESCWLSCCCIWCCFASYALPPQPSLETTDVRCCGWSGGGSGADTGRDSFSFCPCCCCCCCCLRLSL